jgi:hypothetical protein
VSPFSKPHYVFAEDGRPHVAGRAGREALLGDGGKHNSALTLRDASADTLEDLFDFDHAPSLDATIPTAPQLGGRGLPPRSSGSLRSTGEPHTDSGGAPGAVPRRGVAARRAQRTYDLSTCARLQRADDGVNAR